MNRIVAKPLSALSSIISELGSGLFDLVIPCRDRNDEVGDIARAVERLQDSGFEIARLKEASGEAEYQRLLARRADFDGISRRFSMSIETLVAGLDNVATTVAARSREVSTSSNGAVDRLAKVTEASLVARKGMGSVAAATSALLSTIDAIGERTQDGRTAAEKVERHTVSTETALEKLKQTIFDIEGVSQLINGVASQINLIALNATIEAARAGEAGRGFAIVAQEIKILASRTAKATEEIGLHIAAVHRASGVTDTSIGEMREAFTEMRMISGEIAGALDVQLGATSEIARLMDTALASGDAAAPRRDGFGAVFERGAASRRCDARRKRLAERADRAPRRRGRKLSWISAGFLNAASRRLARARRAQEVKARLRLLPTPGGTNWYDRQGRKADEPHAPSTVRSSTSPPCAYSKSTKRY